MLRFNCKRVGPFDYVGFPGKFVRQGKGPCRSGPRTLFSVQHATSLASIIYDLAQTWSIKPLELGLPGRAFTTSLKRQRRQEGPSLALQACESGPHPHEPEGRTPSR